MFIFQPDRHSIEGFVADLAPRMTGKVLDVGAGDGNRYRTYFRHAKYITLDCNAAFSPDLLASADKVPLPDASIDHILMIEVLENIYNLEETVKELARVLKPGGLLVATAPFFAAFCADNIDYWRFTTNSVRKLFEPWFDVKMEWRGGFFSHMVQDAIKYPCFRFNLYCHRWIGTSFSFIVRPLGLFALFLDRRNKHEASKRFCFGVNIIAKRKQQSPTK